MARTKLLSEQLREAMLNSGVSRYRIAKEIGVTEALLSRFVTGVGGLGLETIDKIGRPSRICRDAAMSLSIIDW